MAEVEEQVLTTRQKILIARLLSWGIQQGRAILGRPTLSLARRRDVRWELDLNEGIDLAIYLGLYERKSLAICRRLLSPGAVVLDIGANIGAFTLPLARAAGAQGLVVAFEPTAYGFNKLQRNLSLNPELRARVRLRQEMVLDAPGEPLATIPASWPLHSGQEVHPKLCGAAKTTTGARGITLDEAARELDLARVDLIKLDVDGFEMKVLRGAGQLLRRFRPLVLMELSPYMWQERGERVADLPTLAREAGYQFRALDGVTPVVIDPDDPATLPRDGGGRNLLLWPREREP